MLDIHDIKEHATELKQNIINRQLDPHMWDVDLLLKSEQEKVDLMRSIEKLRQERNVLSDQINKEKEIQARNELIKTAKTVRKEIKKIEEQFDKTTKTWQNLMDIMPNWISSEMPTGKDSRGNVEIKSWGEKPRLPFEAKHHLEIGESLDLIDVKKSGEISGSRFYFLKNEAVELEFALFSWVFQKALKRGFSPIETPVLVREKALYGTGYFPMEKSQIYKLENSDQIEGKADLYLTGTSEQAIVSYHMNDVLQTPLPKKYIGYSPCFRSEAGSWGKDTRGIKRVHQFNKLEMIYFTKPDESQKFMEEALEFETEILQELQLPYHVLEMCSGDVGMATYRKWDVEVWLPSQEEYCETMSNSDLGSYHARRLNIRYEKENGEKEFVHTISATAITNTRIILAILDNFQQKDGSVLIPSVLRSYMNKEKISKK